MLSPELLAQIKGIQLRAGHMVTDVLAGEYASAFKGRGMEFDEVREYVPGDDVRTIDWNVTARLQAPFVKVYREEREMTLMLLVDISASLTFGTGLRRKRHVIAELAAVLAFLAVKNNDKVGLIVFSDQVEEYVPPKKGRAHVWHIIRSVLRDRPQQGKTNVREALDFLSKVQKRRVQAFLLSDFLAGDFSNALKRTASRHDVVGIQVEDPLERNLCDAGLVEFVDVESGEHVVVDSGSKHVRQKFAELVIRKRAALESAFKLAGADLIRVSNDGAFLQPLADLLRQREMRRPRRRK